MRGEKRKEGKKSTSLLCCLALRNCFFHEATVGQETTFPMSAILVAYRRKGKGKGRRNGNCVLNRMES